MSEDKVSKIEQLTTNNKRQYASKFELRVAIALSNVHAMDIADGTLPFPTRPGTLDSNGNEDPNGELPRPVPPEHGCAVADNHYFTAMCTEISHLREERKEYRTRERAGLAILVAALGDDVKERDDIMQEMVSLPRLFQAVMDYTRSIEPGDVDYYDQQFRSFEQHPDERVPAYGLRFQQLVNELTRRGTTHCREDRVHAFVRGLTYKGTLEEYACQVGVTMQDVLHTAVNVENNARRTMYTGEYGSAIIIPDNPRVCSVQLAQSRTAGSSVICRYCNKIGHKAADCYKRKREARYASNNSGARGGRGPFPRHHQPNDLSVTAGGQHDGVRHASTQQPGRSYQRNRKGRGGGRSNGYQNGNPVHNNRNTYKEPNTGQPGGREAKEPGTK